MNEAGALGFRDFPCLPVTKENRYGSHRTLPSLAETGKFRLKLNPLRP